MLISMALRVSFYRSKESKIQFENAKYDKSDTFMHKLKREALDLKSILLNFV